MYETQHNDGTEGDREVGKRRRGERKGDKEGVEVKRRKEEEREGTEGEKKIRSLGERGVRERERGRGRQLAGRKRMEESEGGR